MRLFRAFVIAGLALWIPLTAAAQTRAETQTTITTPTIDFGEETESHWLVSGFVGSNFGQDADEASVDFGGSLGYLWRGTVGGEFLANFSPEFELEGPRRALLLGEQPSINSYMGNAIAAIPVGADRRFQPYVSGGVGVLTLRADTLITDGEQNDIEPDDSRFAGNIGAGVMGFAGNFGIRGDVRYFRGFEGGDDFDPVESPAEGVGNQVLSELTFWRANVGLAIRW